MMILTYHVLLVLRVNVANMLYFIMYLNIYMNPTIFLLSLIKLEQVWLYRLWFKDGIPSVVSTTLGSI